MLKAFVVRARPVTLLVLVLALAFGSVSVALAAGETPTPYYSVETITLGDGSQLDRVTINGPSTPPPGYEMERAPVNLSALEQTMAASSLVVPAYNWVFGCSAVSASMIGAYYDRNGLPNIYTGPTNGGVMPMTNGIWPQWTDSAGSPYPGNPLTASRNGSDGRTTRGSIDDYWVAYNSSAQDPYLTGGWTQHAWGDAFGDYMKTSQSAYSNTDGATSFYNWTTSAAPLTCADMVANNIHTRDGTYGRKLFYEARGYTVTDCYNQKTDNIISGGFSFAQYKAQIDAGRPVFLNLAGHSIVGTGYADPSTVYLNDTWDYSSHTMTWGTSYSGMALQSVSIVNPIVPATTPAVSIGDASVPEGNSGTTIATFTVSLSFAAPGPVTVAWATAINGTATPGTDYTAGSGTVSFATGESTKQVTVAVKGDTTVEPNETFYVNLSNPTGATIADGQGMGTIMNDDTTSAVVLHVGDLDGTKSTAGKKWNATVTITVHDVGHALMSGATVTGNWGAKGSVSCITTNGQCSLSKAGLSAPNITFTVTNVSKSGATYNATANHDPESDSNGTAITIAKP